MEAGALKLDLGGLEGVVTGKAQREPVDHALVDRAGAAVDGTLPAEDVVPLRECWDPWVSTHLKNNGNNNNNSVRIWNFEILKFNSLLEVNEKFEFELNGFEWKVELKDDNNNGNLEVNENFNNNNENLMIEPWIQFLVQIEYKKILE